MSEKPIPSPAVDLDHQLAIAKDLFAFASEVCVGTLHAETEFTRKDYIFFALVDKNIATFEAVRILSERGLADDAFALDRVLAECMINASYVVHGTDQVANDYADYPDYRDWVEYEQLRAIAPEMVSDVPADEVKTMREKYETVKDRYKRNREWCADNLFQRAAKLDSGVAGDFNLLRIIVNTAWRKASAYVHGSASSLASRVRESEGGIIIHREFTREQAAGALYVATMIMFAMLVFVDLRLGKRHVEEWKALYERWGKAAARNT